MTSQPGWPEGKLSNGSVETVMVDSGFRGGVEGTTGVEEDSCGRVAFAILVFFVVLDRFCSLPVSPAGAGRFLSLFFFSLTSFSVVAACVTTGEMFMGDVGREGMGDAGRDGKGDAGRGDIGDERTGDAGREGIGDERVGDAGREGIGDEGRVITGDARREGIREERSGVWAPDSEGVVVITSSGLD